MDRFRRKGVIGRAGGHLSCIYNDWLRDFCSHYPDREIGFARLPYGDIDDAVKEIRRAAKMGIKGLELSCSWDMEPMWHPVWESLWNAVEDVQLPLFPHFPDDLAPGPRRRLRPGSPRRDVHRGLGLPDGAHQHHRRIDRRRRLGASSAAQGLVRRERHRLAALCARPHGFRV